MYSFNSFLGKCFDGYRANRAEKQNLAFMFAMGDRQLADIGVTRGDLKFQTSKAGFEAKAKRKAEKQAIKELRAMSDAELHDLGITRGNIVEAVRYGRTGLDEQPLPASKVRESNRAEQRQAAYELSQMSDAQLEDIGVGRDEIKTLVANGRPVSQSKARSMANAHTVNSGLVVVGGTEADAANSDLNDNAPKPPRSPLNRPAAA